MDYSNLRKFLPLAVPVGLIALALLFYSRLEAASDPVTKIIIYSPYVVFFIGLILSYWFNRSRIFFIIAFLAAFQLIFQLAPSGAKRDLYLHAVYTLGCLLLPVNILVFSLIRERGIATRRGRTRAFFVLGQVLFMVWAGFSGSSLVAVVNLKLITLSAQEITPLPQLSVLAFSVTFFVFLARLWLKPTPMEGSFAGALLSAALALHLVTETTALPVFFALAGIMLTAAVIQDSYRKAYLDELTSLPGRRALKESLVNLEGKYSIAMVDIDFFKKFNDSYGHDVGDEVLRLIASSIKNVAGGGKAFRYGGEEFTILFPGKGLDDALPHLEELRERIAKRTFTIRGKDRPRKKPDQVTTPTSPTKRISITVSIGVSQSRGGLKTAEDIIKDADDALYRAKKQGRNRVSK